MSVGLHHASAPSPQWPVPRVKAKVLTAAHRALGQREPSAAPDSFFSPLPWDPPVQCSHPGLCCPSTCQARPCPGPSYVHAGPLPGTLLPGRCHLSAVGGVPQPPITLPFPGHTSVSLGTHLLPPDICIFPQARSSPLPDNTE